MELLQLTYFCDAASTQNFSRTAKRYDVPPSNISQSIKRLEDELGVTLFDRNANRVELNSRGETFYRQVGSALELIRQAEREVRGSTEEGTLRLGIRISRRIVMQAVSAFQSQYSSVNIVAEHGDHTQSDDFDLIISDRSFTHRDFVRMRAFREQIVLAARKGLFESGERFSASNLGDKPFITMSANYSMHVMTQEICRDLGFKPRIALQGEDPVYVRRCVEAGLGIAFVPALSWRGQFSPEVELYRVGDYSRDICIYCRKNAGQAKHTDIFYRMLVDTFEQEMLAQSGTSC